MQIASPIDSRDVHRLLDMVGLQLNWLEREITTLRLAIRREEEPSVLRPTFKSLRGIWIGIVVSDKDFAAARITLPEDLT